MGHGRESIASRIHGIRASRIEHWDIIISIWSRDSVTGTILKTLLIWSRWLGYIGRWLSDIRLSRNRSSTAYKRSWF